MNQVELKIIVTKMGLSYNAEIIGIKNGITVSGPDKSVCIQKAKSKIRNIDLFDIVIEDLT